MIIIFIIYLSKIKKELTSKIQIYNNKIINKDILELSNNIKNNIDNQKIEIENKKSNDFFKIFREIYFRLQ